MTQRGEPDAEDGRRIAYGCCIRAPGALFMTTQSVEWKTQTGQALELILEGQLAQALPDNIADDELE